MKDEPNGNSIIKRSSFVLHAIIFAISHIIMIMLASAFPTFCMGIIWVTPIWCTAMIIHCFACIMLNERILNTIVNA